MLMASAVVRLGGAPTGSALLQSWMPGPCLRWPQMLTAEGAQSSSRDANGRTIHLCGSNGLGVACSSCWEIGKWRMSFASFPLKHGTCFSRAHAASSSMGRVEEPHGRLVFKTKTLLCACASCFCADYNRRLRDERWVAAICIGSFPRAVVSRPFSIYRRLARWLFRGVQLSDALACV